MRHLLALAFVVGSIPTVDAQTWTPRTPPPKPIGPGACAATDGGVTWLLVGGGTADFLSYDAAADAWTVRAPLLGPAGAGAGLVGDGAAFLFAFAGEGTKAFFKYSIAGDAWTPPAIPPHPFSDGSGVAMSGGFAFALHGGGLLHFSRYDPALDAWSARAALPGSASPGTRLITRADGRILCIRGGTTEVEVYDPALDSWSPGVDVPTVAGPGSSIGIDPVDGRLFYHPGGTSGGLFVAPADGSSWTAVSPAPPGLPAPQTLIIPIPGEVTLLKPTEYVSLPSVFATPECDCESDADFGGCSAGPAGGNVAPLAAGLALLFYARRRRASS